MKYFIIIIFVVVVVVVVVVVLVFVLIFVFIFVFIFVLVLTPSLAGARSTRRCRATTSFEIYGKRIGCLGAVGTCSTSSLKAGPLNCMNA